MEKIFRLHELDCANCAMKIERKVAKLEGVRDVNVDFVQKKMVVALTDASVIDGIITLINELEPGVVVEDISKEGKVKDEHHHEHAGTCDCGHEHTHEHQHEHVHQNEGCSCDCKCDETSTHERVLGNAVKFKILGLDCASCADKVERAILAMPEVVDASLNFSTNLLFVETKTADAALKEKLQKVINQVEDGVSLSASEEEAVDVSGSSWFKDNLRLWSGIVLFIIAIIFEEQDYAVYIFLLSFMVTGGKVMYTAFRNIMRKEIFDENFLMSIATIGAFAIGNYKEGVAVMIFYEIGEMFQAYAVNRSRKSISSLMNIRADFAIKLMDGKEVKVAPESVHVDDVILIKAGERVALDGVLTQGESSLDTSALTGESLPRDVHVGDEILAGSVNLSGVIQVRVQKEYGESTVSRILELVENASSKKAPMEKFITKFARIYTPVVVALALALVVLPMLFIPDAEFYDWLYRALTFLVVSCPCALVVSIPLGLFAGIGKASKHGILIKGGNCLEALADVDTVVFDKTGTLTKGSFKVFEQHAFIGSEADLSYLGAYGEYYSNHPIAKSIVSAYEQTVDTSKISNYEEIAGNGIRVCIDGDIVLLGNTKLMDSNQITYPVHESVGTIVHIAKNDAYMGYIAIADEIKETSAKAIQALKANGVKRCVMLTGDRENVAQAVGKQLQLDQVYAELLPQDKVEKVESLLANEEPHKKLAFVGDGINDAPVLARADIGVAMGGIGSDAAIEAADVVLMKDDPAALAEAITISHKTKRILWQNIIFSLGVKGIVLVLSAMGYADMWMGVFADVGVTLLAVLNSMRALKS